uniref:F-box domain-containing protein n=1 Tax=Triticum urartu TaxID=4572 RepID=A0A8R7P7K9_TRIUA
MPRNDAKLPRRRRPRADRLGDLSDDLLHDILRRLDTRTALGTAALSRRWASLPREVPVLDLKVTDIVPPRYHRCIRLRSDARKSKISSTLSDRRLLEAIAARYERRAMRAMVRSVKNLLASRARRRVEKLSLEVFAYSTSACINRLVVDAVDSWGVRDLEVVATPTGPLASPKPPAYSFPHGIISRKPGESRLRSLKLANCLPRALLGFNALTTLVLRDPLPSRLLDSGARAVLPRCHHRERSDLAVYWA